MGNYDISRVFRVQRVLVDQLSPNRAIMALWVSHGVVVRQSCLNCEVLP